MRRSALGFTIKSGWACAVVLDDSRPAPTVVDSRRIELSDPADPEARQPYHAARGTARTPGPELARLIASVKTFGRASVMNFIRDQEKAGRAFEGAGLVVGSLVDPATITNDHIRIHALEGLLFREVVKEATDRRKMASFLWRERDVYGTAAVELKRSESDVRETVAGLARHVKGPWRAEHKAAALAAWLVMALTHDQGRTGRAGFK